MLYISAAVDNIGSGFIELNEAMGRAKDTVRHGLLYYNINIGVHG